MVSLVRLYNMTIQNGGNNKYVKSGLSVNTDDTIGFRHSELETSTLSDITINPMAGGSNDYIKHMPKRDRYTEYEYAFKKTVNKDVKDVKDGGAYQYSSVSENDLNALRNIILSDNQTGGGCGCEGEQTFIKKLNDISDATSTMATIQQGGALDALSETSDGFANLTNKQKDLLSDATSTLATIQQGGVLSSTSEISSNNTVSKSESSNVTSDVIGIQYNQTQLGGYSATSPLNESDKTVVDTLKSGEVDRFKQLGEILMKGGYNTTSSDFSLSRDSSDVQTNSSNGITYETLVGGVVKRKSSKKSSKKSKNVNRKSSRVMARSSKTEDETIDKSSSTTQSSSVTPSSNRSSTTSKSSSSVNINSSKPIYPGMSPIARSINPDSKSDSPSSISSSKSSSTTASASYNSTNSQSDSQSQSQSQSRMYKSSSYSSTYSSSQSRSQSETNSSPHRSSTTESTTNTGSSNSDTSMTSKSGNSSDSSGDVNKVGEYRTLQRNYPTSSSRDNDTNSDVINVKQFYSSDHGDLYSSSETNFLKNNLSKNRFR